MATTKEEQFPKKLVPILDYEEIHQDNDEVIFPLLFLKIFSGYPELSKPLMPFILLKYIATHYLEVWIKTSLEFCFSLYGDEDTLNRLTTSCINTARALVLLFMGEEQACHLFTLLTRDSSAPCTLTLPSGKKWNYQIKNLLIGDLVYGISHDSDFEQLSEEEKLVKYNQYSDENIENFFNYNN